MNQYGMMYMTDQWRFRGSVYILNVFPVSCFNYQIHHTQRHFRICSQTIQFIKPLYPKHKKDTI